MIIFKIRLLAKYFRKFWNQEKTYFVNNVQKAQIIKDNSEKNKYSSAEHLMNKKIILMACSLR